MASGSRLNFRLSARAAAAVAVVAVALVLFPVAKCTLSTLGDDSAPAPAESQAEALDTVLGSEDGFFDRLGGGVSECRQRYPVTGAPMWQIAGFGGGLVFFVVFTLLGRIDRKRSVKLQTQKQRQARKQLRKERRSRPTGSAGHERVPTPLSGASQLPRAAGGSGMHSILDDSDDPLLALDRAIEERATSGASEIPRPMGEFPPLDDELETSLTDLPSIEDLSADEVDAAAGPDSWAPSMQAPLEAPAAFAETAPPVPAGDDFARADDDAAAPFAPLVGIEDTAPSIPAGAIPIDGDGGEPTLLGAEFIAPVYIGNDIALDIQGSGLIGVADQLEIGLALETSDGRRAPVWSMARTLATAGSHGPVPGGVRLSIPWRSFGGVLLEHARDEGVSISQLHLSLTLDPRTMRLEAPVCDAFIAHVTSADGQPSEPRTVLLTSASGRTVRGWIGANGAGRLEVDDVEPGTCTIELDDGSPLSLPGEPAARQISLSTIGAGFASPTEGPPPSAAYSLAVRSPAIVYVSATAAGQADGSRDRPFARLNDAVDHVLAQRRAGNSQFDAAELRVDPTARMPSTRPGLATPGPDSEWLKWWKGLPADQNADWTRPEKQTLLRTQNADQTGLGLYEELILEDVTDLRIVNSAYAELRDRIARSPGFEARLSREYGDIPLVHLAAPQDGTSHNARIELRNCERVLIEGVHLVGCSGQSGIVIRDSKAVMIRRCWINLFSSGATAAGGVFGVGRGIQIDHSGGSTPNEAIRVEHCDIGWNHAARRAVPIRGAGVALYNSNAELIRCYVHHNQATQGPADLVAQGESSVRGEACVRDDNQVLAG